MSEPAILINKTEMTALAMSASGEKLLLNLLDAIDAEYYAKLLPMTPSYRVWMQDDFEDEYLWTLLKFGVITREQFNTALDVGFAHMVGRS